jgi:hypothetical protein
MKRYAKFETRDPHPEVPFADELDEGESVWLFRLIAAAIMLIIAILV